METKALVLCVFAILIYYFHLFSLTEKVFAGGSFLIKDNATQEVVINHADKYIKNLYRPIWLSKQSSNSNQINWLELLIGAFIGWISGLFSVLIIDHLKEPNLIFEVGSISEDSTNKWRFIHIKIKNLKRKCLYSPFTTTIAFACKSIIKIKKKSFVGRWTSKEQPIGNISNVINIALVQPREDIHPYTVEQEAVEVAIGIKYENENEFYGFNNESYLPVHKGFRNMTYQFNKGEFNSEIIISTLGKTYSQKFKIYNKSKRRYQRI